MSKSLVFSRIIEDWISKESGLHAVSSGQALVWPAGMPMHVREDFLELVMKQASRKDILMSTVSVLLESMPASMCAAISGAFATGSQSKLAE